MLAGGAPKAARYLAMKPASALGSGAAYQPPSSAASRDRLSSSHRPVPRSWIFDFWVGLVFMVGAMARSTGPPWATSTASAPDFATLPAGSSAPAGVGVNW